MTKWIIDTGHSDVHFRARYLVISHVTGEFRKFEGTVETNDDNFSNARINFSVDTASIDTNNQKRDADLRAEDFFNCSKFPKMEFVSTAMIPTGENEYRLMGNLTVKGGTRPVELKVTSGGLGSDTEGKQRAGFEITGVINRYEFGLVWALIHESGAIILGEDVGISANVQLVKVSS